MSFDDFESSRALGKPIYLYYFRYGPADSAYYAYTNAETAVAFTVPGETSPRTFEPKTITHGEIISSGNLDRSNLEVKAAAADNIVPTAGRFSSAVTTLRIFEAHDGESGYALAWAGRVLGKSSPDVEDVLTCEPASTSLRRIGNRRNFQYRCPLALYGPECRASLSAVSADRTTVAVNGARVTLASGWNGSLAREKFLAGIVSWTKDGREESRMIVGVDVDENANLILLSSSASHLEEGMTVSVAPGCNHLMEDCAGVHDNILNFGGDAWIPTQNPLGLNNNFY